MSWRTMERARQVPELELVWPWGPSLGEVLERPWSEDVDLYDALNGTDLRGELEAAGVPLIPYEGSSTQAEVRRVQAQVRRGSA